MSDKSKFIADKLSIEEFKLVQGQIDNPEEFDEEKVEGHHSNSGLKLGYNLEDKLIKADFTVDIVTESRGANTNEAKGNFHFVYIFKVENLEELVEVKDESHLQVEGILVNSVASITYSTSRGVLLTRLQGTALHKYVLPIIDPSQLLQNGPTQ